MPHLDFQLWMVEVEFKEELLDALSLHQPPLCVVEWRIPIMGTRKDEAALIADGAPSHVAAMLAGAFTDTIPAYEVFQEAVSRSPDTKFIIACHNQGYDVPKAHEAEFMQHPSAIKRMGFINGLVNMRYLAKLFTRTYAGRTWQRTF
jgi:pyruvate dehydrogenase complex dehydrogenase (E1) component